MQSNSASSLPQLPRLLRVAASLTLMAAFVATAGLPPEEQAKPQPPPRQPDAPAIPPELEKMHAEHLHLFATSPGFGDMRTIRMPRQAQVTLAGATYTVVRPDLIALETKAVAYRTPFSDEVVKMAMLTNKTAKARLQTRPITGEESRAILELREGKDLVHQSGTWQAPQGKERAPVEVPVVRVVGAMRATASCAKCHEVPQGTLLGAFSYTLVAGSAAPAAHFPFGSVPVRSAR